MLEIIGSLTISHVERKAVASASTEKMAVPTMLRMVYCRPMNL